MPLMAAVTTAAESDDPGVSPELALNEDGIEPGATRETEATENAGVGDSGNDSGDARDGSEQSGDPSAANADTTSGDVVADEADPASADDESDVDTEDPSQAGNEEQTSDDETLADETGAEPQVEESGAAAEAPTATDAPSSEQTPAGAGGAPDQGEPVDAPIVETTAVPVDEPIPAPDAEIVADQAQVDGTGHTTPTPDAAPIVENTRVAQKQAASLEKKRRKADAVDSGLQLLASLLLTYEVDVDLPSPARTPKISEGFAKRLTTVADRHGADWALVLGAVRALDYRGDDPADNDLLELLASKLAGVDRTTSVTGLRAHLTLVERDAARATALARYYRAAGLDGLVKGLDGARDGLEQRVLAHPEISLPQEGRADIENGRIGVRVLVALLYLAEKHDDVVVSSLKTGHRIFARPGVVSAHVYGQAVDIAALDGVSILGHQGPGSVTEIAVRDLISLPAEVYPRQVISLHDMGGSSFAEPREHHNHIHIGF